MTGGGVGGGVEGACEEECHQPLTANIAVVENQETYWRYSKGKQKSRLSRAACSRHL